MDLAKRFCELFDRLDEETVVNRYAEWRLDTDFNRRARAAEDAALRRESLPSPADQNALLAVLKGLDRAFKRIHPLFMGSVVPDVLATARRCYRLTGRFNTDPDDGALLPKLATPNMDVDEPDRLDLVFDYVVRVVPEQCRNVVRVSVAPSQRLSARARAAGLVVGCVAFIDDESELEVSVVRRGALDHYRIAIRADPTVEQRVQDAIDGFDRTGVQLGVVPEMACSQRLLELWSDALARRPARVRSALQWVVVGTGDLHGDDPPRNTAAIVDARTGGVIVEQSKQYRFAISPDQQRDVYRLKAFTGTRSLREDIYVPRRTAIVELGAARVTVLVCEDLERLESLLARLNTNGVSHIVVPVFAQPIRAWHWEQAAGQAHARSTGSVVVVANSLVVARVMGAKMPAACSLVHTPHGSVLQAASGPLEPMRSVVHDGRTPTGLDRTVLP